MCSLDGFVDGILGPERREADEVEIRSSDGQDPFTGRLIVVGAEHAGVETQVSASAPIVTVRERSLRSACRASVRR